MTVEVCYRPNFTDAGAPGRDAAGRMRAKGNEVVHVALDAVRDAQLKGVEIACVFGGDGTMLHAARALAPRGVPLLGVNLGHLGFLTMVQIAEFDAAFNDVASGRFSVEERAMLEGRLMRGGSE